MTETRVRAIREAIIDAYPRPMSLTVYFELGYYWFHALTRASNGVDEIEMTGFLSKDEIWGWTDKYAAAVVLLRMSLNIEAA